MSRMETRIVGSVKRSIPKTYSFNDETIIPMMLFIGSVAELQSRYINVELDSYFYDTKAKIWRLNITSHYPVINGETLLGYRKYDQTAKPLTDFLPYHDGRLHLQAENNKPMEDILPVCEKCGKQTSSPLLYFMDSEHYVRTYEIKCLHNELKSSDLWSFVNYTISNKEIVKQIKQNSKISPVIALSLIIAYERQASIVSVEHRKAMMARLIFKYNEERNFSFPISSETINDNTLSSMFYINWVINEMPKNTDGLQLLARLVQKEKINRTVAVILSMIPEMYRQYTETGGIVFPYDNFRKDFSLENVEGLASPLDGLF